MDVLTILLYVIGFVIVMAITFFVFLTVTTGQVSTINTIAISGTAILQNIANKAIAQGGNILLGGLDFLNAIYAEISVTLANITEQFARIVQTVGVFLHDQIQLYSTVFLIWMNELNHYLNGVFELAIIPTFNAVDRIFNIIIQIIVDLVGTFNPNTC